MSLNDLPAHTIELIAGFTDPQHMAMLISTSKTMCSILTASSLAWYAIGKHICGSDYWDNGFERWMVKTDGYKPSESPYSFTRRMMCPWLEPPQSIDLHPPSAPNHHPRKYTAWKIDLAKDEGRKDGSGRGAMEVCMMDHEKGNSDEYFFVDEGEPGWELFTSSHYIPARPFDDRHASMTNPFDAKVIYGDLEHVRATVVEALKGTTHFDAQENQEFRISFPTECIHLHSSVVVALFGLTDRGTVAHAIAFVSTHTNRLLHFSLTNDAGDMSFNRIVMRPGELWVLNTANSPEPPILQYYGPKR